MVRGSPGLLNSCYGTELFEDPTFEIPALITMDSGRESIVNDKGIKEHMCSGPSRLVGFWHSHGKLCEMVSHDQHIGGSTTSIFEGEEIQSNHLHCWTGDDVLQRSTLR